MRWDYHRVCQCLNFRFVKKEKPEGASYEEVERLYRQRATADCNNWAEYLVVEKKRQMQVEDPSVWPPKPWPWEFKDALTMPVVIWVIYKKPAVDA